jgi:hypothetical protein
MMAKSKAVSVAPGGKSEAEYRAESDARTLTDAHEIRQDPARYKAACAALKGKADTSAKALELEHKVKKGLKAAFTSDSSGGSNY